LDEMRVRLERLGTMRAAHVHVLSDAPEEGAMKKMIAWAERKGIGEARLFGRNTYPTDNPEPHGYELFLTVGPEIQPDESIDIVELHSGLCAVLRFQNLNEIGEAWKKLWGWIEESKREHIGMKKGEYGWVDGYEEHLNWHEKKPQNEWIFDLWLQLKE
jgi:DNA gyrase inhibitor GyrI